MEEEQGAEEERVGVAGLHVGELSFGDGWGQVLRVGGLGSGLWTSK
ncbi:MAG: hypothetical protein RI897_1366 [Verrucomicrobiota bacterium]|jgi:hypothetical protein